jgi:hypothetical protein
VEKRRAPNNASKQQVRFNSALKGLKLYGIYWINFEPVVLDMAYSFPVSEVFV